MPVLERYHPWYQEEVCNLFLPVAVNALGKALLGRRVGERFHIQVNDRYGYDAVVRAIQKGQDDGSVPLSSF